MVYNTSQNQYQATPALFHLTSELIKYDVEHTSLSACPVHTRTKTQQLLEYFKAYSYMLDYEAFQVFDKVSQEYFKYLKHFKP